MNEDNEQTRGLSPDKEKLYLLAASQPLRDVATLMLEIGMRPEEVCCSQHREKSLSALVPASNHHLSDEARNH